MALTLDCAFGTRPAPHQSVCGDRAGVQVTETGTLVWVADGLGHGRFAYDAVLLIQEYMDRAVFPHTLGACMAALHKVLRSSVGAAVGLALWRPGSVTWLGVGNIACIYWDNVTHREHRVGYSPGIVGYGRLPKLRPQRFAFGAGDRLIMHSDGVVLPCLARMWQVERPSRVLVWQLLALGADGADDAGIALLQGSHE